MRSYLRMYNADNTAHLLVAAERELRSVTSDSPDTELVCIIEAGEAGLIQGEVYITQGCGCFYSWLWSCRTDHSIADDYDDDLGDKNNLVQKFKANLIGYENDRSPLEKYITSIDMGDRPTTNPRLEWLVTTLQAILYERGAA